VSVWNFIVNCDISYLLLRLLYHSFFAYYCLRRNLMGKKTEHSFSIELKSEQCVRRMSFLDKETGFVFFEGFLGELRNVAMVEGVMLEIEGENGVLKLDITRQEMEKCLAPRKTNGGEK
jgi:hypothetical protein